MTHSNLLQDFAAKATLTNLRVVSMEASADAAGEPANIEARFEASSRVSDADDPQVDYRVRNETNVSDTAGQVLFSIRSTWRLSFTFTEPPKSTDDAVLREFQSAVVMMTVVPYVRELVSSTAARFGFPSVMVPLIKASELQEAPSGTTTPEPTRPGESSSEQ